MFFFYDPHYGFRSDTHTILVLPDEENGRKVAIAAVAHQAVNTEEAGLDVTWSIATLLEQDLEQFGVSSEIANELSQQLIERA